MELWRPFTAVGLAGGWILWGIHQAGWLSERGMWRWLWGIPGAHQCPLGVILFALVPVAMLWLGVLVESRSSGRLRRLLVGGVAGGVLLGALVLVLNGQPFDAIFGMLLGALHSVPFLIAALAIAGAARLAWARPGTPPGRAERRAPWLAAAVTVAVAAPILKAQVPPLGTVPLALAGFSAATVALVLAFDLAELIPLCGLLAEAASATPRIGAPALAESGAQFADLGVGDRCFDQIEPGAAYRGTDRLMRRLRGDPSASLRALACAILRDVVVLVVCGGIFAVLASY